MTKKIHLKKTKKAVSYLYLHKMLNQCRWNDQFAMRANSRSLVTPPQSLANLPPFFVGALFELSVRVGRVARVDAWTADRKMFLKSTFKIWSTGTLRW